VGGCDAGNGDPRTRLVFQLTVGRKLKNFTIFTPLSLDAGIYCDDNARSLGKGVPLVRITTTDPLFAWEKLPDSPDLISLRFLLESLPDAPLLAALRAHRGKGRNDYPMHVLWRVHLSRYLLRHASMEACLADLGRNPALRRVIGIEDAQGVPEAWNMSRFLEVLGQPNHLALMQEMFRQMTRRLGGAVSDLGQNLAGDSAALSARKSIESTAPAAGKGGDPVLDLPKSSAPGSSKGRVVSLPVLGVPDADAAPQLPQPAGGRKEYKDETGKVVKTYEWFGFKFHLLVDVKHEVVVAWHVTSAAGEGSGDSSVIPLLLDEAKQVLPEGRIKTLAYDKAADDQKTHEVLAKEHIKPLIQIRELWKEEPERMLPGHDGNSNVVHDEAGTIFCHDKVSPIPVKHKMSYMGYEKDRGTLKYRCPARHEGFQCPSDQRCNGDSSYGKTVRVNCNIDLRRFPPIPRATIEFERRYKGRTAVERINARLKVYWGADDGNVTGAARFHAHMATILLVHSAMANWLAVQPRYEGKSLSPTRMSQVAQRLHKVAAAH
jgi:hypothetical protein